MAEQTDIAELAAEAKARIKDGVLGPGMRRLTMQRQSALQDLRNSGRLKPATVLNFNPVSLLVDDGNVRWRIPSCVDKHKKSVKIEHGGRTYTAAALTIREAAFVAWIRDVRPPSDEGENPSSEYDSVFILPLELADQYRIMYNDPAGQMMMGGVVVFEGDTHEFMKSKSLRVPKFDVLPDRKRSYKTTEVDLAKELAGILTMQKAYCQKMIQQGDEYNQDDENRKNITPIHRLWAQYALDMGWKEVAPPWMNAQLESEESCKGCGKGKKRNDAWFCECGRPYNAFSAFMAGENVPESYLFALKGDEQTKALSELGRRKALMAKFATPAPPTP